jgi:hypothetical protein
MILLWSIDTYSEILIFLYPSRFWLQYCVHHMGFWYIINKNTPKNKIVQCTATPVLTPTVVVDKEWRSDGFWLYIRSEGREALSLCAVRYKSTSALGRKVNCSVTSGTSFRKEIWIANCRKGTSPKNLQYEFSPSWYSSVTDLFPFCS